MGGKPKKSKENDRNILTAKNAVNVDKILTKPCRIRLSRRLPGVIQTTSSSEPIKLRKCRVMLKRINLDHEKVREPGSSNAISSLKRKQPEMTAKPEITKFKTAAFDSVSAKETAKRARGGPKETHSTESQRIASEKLNKPKEQTTDKQNEQSKNASLNSSSHRKFFISGPRDRSRSAAFAVAATPVKPSSRKIDSDDTARRDITSRTNISTTAAKTRIRRCAVKLIRIKAKDGSPSVLRQKKKADTKSAEPLRSQSPDLFSDEEACYHGDVYSFPSQSSLSEVDDAAADVIAKLKKEGKVVVSKARRQGTKPRGKVPVKPAKWQAVVKNLPKVTVSNAKKPTTRTKKQPRDISATVTFSNDDNNFVDNFEHFELNIQKVASNPTARIEKQAANISFSALAQKTLRKEMLKANTTSTPDTKKAIRPANIKRSKAELLEMARSFIRRSAPKSGANSSVARQLSNHSTPNRLPAQFSASVNNRIRDASIASSSPWRVNSEQMPRLFHFSRANDDLPSYSSDVMPSSQPSSKPHDSLNISNIENISPVKSIENRQNAEKALIGLNPRRGFAARSPLKAINVLNVVTLPFRATVKPIDNATVHKENVESFSNEQSNVEHNEPSVIDGGRNDHVNDKSKDITADFFGFDDQNFEVNDDPLPSPKTKIPSKRRLHNKLVRLRQLLPPKPTRLSYNTIQTVFKPIEKQTDIREMLSSTRNNPNESNAEISNFIDVSRHEQTFDCGQDPSSSVDREIRLFEEPETTFDRSIKVKTYQRVPKRNMPRKCHNFVLFASDEEDEEDVMPIRKKRTKADKKQEKELKEFVHEFKSMCDEVDRYKLVVEKDKSQNSST